MSYFPDVPKITFEGPESKNPLAFKHYNPDEEIEGKKPRMLLRTVYDSGRARQRQTIFTGGSVTQVRRCVKIVREPVTSSCPLVSPLGLHLQPSEDCDAQSKVGQR